MLGHSAISATAFGETKTLKEWANNHRCVVSIQALRHRIKHGWTAEDALTRQAHKHIPRKSLVGVRSGKLVAIARAGYDKKVCCPIYKCLCDCGGETFVRHTAIERGETKSCGCVHKERWARRKPKPIPKPRGKQYTLWGITQCLFRWATDGRCVVSRSGLRKRMLAGWELERAMITRRKGSHKHHHTWRAVSNNYRGWRD